MLTWLIYDIASDRARKKISDSCKDYGLYRVQKSVFLGKLNANRTDEIVEKSRELINTKTDSLYVIPICNEDFAKAQILGQGFDGELVADELLTKVV